MGLLVSPQSDSHAYDIHTISAEPVRIYYVNNFNAACLR